MNAITSVGQIFLPEVPIYVQSKRLDLGLLPDWSAILHDLPRGVGVKGGIARKILKVISGLNHSHPDFRSEKDGNGDIDILVAIRNLTPELRLNIRQAFSGMKLGNMEVLPKDIEVTDSFTDYFRSRDVTMNEVLALRTDGDTVMLYYTAAAQGDIEQGVIAPSIHCLKTVFGQMWHYDESGRLIVAPKNLCRCIVRWVKGHGLRYGVDSNTWSYYQKHGLNPKDLFRILKNFVDDDNKFLLCHRHLVGLGIIDKNSDPNYLWGEAMFEVNSALARHGKRLTFEEPNAEQIEEWIRQKEREFRNWEIDRMSKMSVGFQVEPDVEALVYFPDGIQNFPAFYA